VRARTVIRRITNARKRNTKVNRAMVARVDRINCPPSLVFLVLLETTPNYRSVSSGRPLLATRQKDHPFRLGLASGLRCFTTAIAAALGLLNVSPDQGAEIILSVWVAGSNSASMRVFWYTV
jgi:hypothetical protein